MGSPDPQVRSGEETPLQGYANGFLAAADTALKSPDSTIQNTDGSSPVIRRISFQGYEIEFYRIKDTRITIEGERGSMIFHFDSSGSSLVVLFRPKDGSTRELLGSFPIGQSGGQAVVRINEEMVLAKIGKFASMLSEWGASEEERMARDDEEVAVDLEQLAAENREALELHVGEF